MNNDSPQKKRREARRAEKREAKRLARKASQAGSPQQGKAI